ncbi:hypothetical protein [Paraburkholderia phytofirmans]|uniref:Uncharacterized protein n=1 Tax=Paraburkholderia phytofirmans OLGA172 TaxID=1417228 RepID=A0A160FV08_9BURK|nr:hypothetical protein AYM40_32905 [Paraburkholderia phytofirmans OLGA172]
MKEAVAHVHKSKIAIYRNAFNLAWNAPGLLDVAQDAVEPIWKKRIVLNIWPAHEIRIQVRLALVEDLLVDSVKHL